MQRYHWIVLLSLLVGATVSGSTSVPGSALAEMAEAVPTQTPLGEPLPYDRPPKAEEGAPGVTVPPLTDPLSPEQMERAEALLPLLEGEQELWAMAEFVHLGPGAVPVLTQALSMPGPRIRYNAIETMSMIKHSSAVPALLETAKQPYEMPRIREHALRVSVRLDPAQTPPAIAVMAKDSNSSVRNVAAFESRYVREKAVIPVLIGLIPDEERFVGTTAVQSLWKLTDHPTEMHDWASSTQHDRQEWAEEWTQWWESAQETFEFPDPRAKRQRSRRS